MIWSQGLVRKNQHKETPNIIPTLQTNNQKDKEIILLEIFQVDEDNLNHIYTLKITNITCKLKGQETTGFCGGITNSMPEDYATQKN